MDVYLYINIGIKYINNRIECEFLCKFISLRAQPKKYDGLSIKKLQGEEILYLLALHFCINMYIRIDIFLQF